MDIAVIGGYGVGHVFQVERFPGPGESLSALSFDVMHGGKGSNQAVGASRLGAQVTLLSAIGRDEWAEHAQALWREHAIDDSNVLRADAATMVGAIMVDDSGENRIVIARGALDALSAPNVDSFRPAIARADLLVASLEVPTEVVVSAIGVAREVGTPVLLNPAPASLPFPTALFDVDYLTPNATEAALIAGLDVDGVSPEHLLERLRSFTSARIALTLGSEGVLVSVPGQPSRRVPAASARRVVDTTGAGDSFTAALAAAICSGAEFLDAVQWAAAAGAHTVSVAGVIPALPYPHDLPSMPVGQTAQAVSSPERNHP